MGITTKQITARDFLGWHPDGCRMLNLTASHNLPPSCLTNPQYATVTELAIFGNDSNLVEHRMGITAQKITARDFPGCTLTAKENATVKIHNHLS